MTNSSFDVVILAGGQGTRLRAAIGTLPKPLALVCNRPFIFHLLDRLVLASPRQIILATGYRSEMITGAVGGSYRGISIRHLVEDEPLGTGGALCRAVRLASTQTVLAMNGDTLLDIPISSFLAAHRAWGAGLSLAVIDVPDTSRYGRVDVDGKRVIGFGEKGQVGPGLINAGVYAVDQTLLERYCKSISFSFETDLLAAHINNIRPLGYRVNGLFIDIGIPEELARANRILQD